MRAALVLVTLLSSTVAADTGFDDVVLVGNATDYFCSGVVVAPRKVLTAAHCVPATRIALGPSIDDARDIAVVAAVSHDTEDVAILTLAADVTTRHSIRLQHHEAPTAEIAIVGFGMRDPVRVTGFGTRRVRRVTPDGWGCDRRRSRELGCRVDTELLLRGGRDNDTCFGDSGGGAFERIGGGKWRLIGITSRGTSPKRVVCGEGGVYVRTDAITTWLLKEGVGT